MPNVRHTTLLALLEELVTCQIEFSIFFEFGRELRILSEETMMDSLNGYQNLVEVTLSGSPDSVPQNDTGLGLETIVEIIRRRGGRVWIDSTSGPGVLVKFILPEKDNWANGADDHCDVSKRESILVVDDDDQLRQMICQLLRADGYQVLEAGTGDAAISICREPSVQIQLIITDVVMPKFSGHRLASEVIALRPEIRILLVSGYPTLSGIIDRRLLRTETSPVETDFLRKPFSRNELRQKVRDLLQRTSRVSA